MKDHSAELETFYFSNRGHSVLAIKNRINFLKQEIQDLEDRMKDLMGELYEEESTNE